jgi:aryl-alcohol dehydrogenase-like predicted oxidoreductase
LKAVDELRVLVPAGWSMPQFALRWILMFEAVTCTIPGAKNPVQAEDNVKAAELPALDADTMDKVRAIYDLRIRDLVHNYW